MLGEFVYAQQTLIYDTQAARDYLYGLSGVDPTDEEVLVLINSWAGEEFGPGDYALFTSEGVEL